MRHSVVACCFGMLMIVCTAGGGMAAPLAYEQAIDHVRQLGAEGRYAEAEAILERLEQSYPDNPEVAAFQGRLALWQKRYAMAAQYVRRSLALRHDEELVRLLEQIEVRQQLAFVDSWLALGETSRALETLVQLCNQEREPYESCRRLGLLQLRLNQAGAAYTTLHRLQSRYPNDGDIALMALRALGANGGHAAALEQLQGLPLDWQQRPDAVALREELQLAFERLERQLHQEALDRLLKEGDGSGASQLFERLPHQEQAALVAGAPDLPYRLRQHNLRISGTLAGDSRGMPLEKQLDLSLTYRMPWLTMVVQGGWASRYGQSDQQAGLELYVRLSEDRRRNLMLAGSFSPGASFLPRSALGIELSQGSGNWEFGLGGNRLDFADDTVHLVVPRVTWYLAGGWSLGEQLYLVTENGSVTSQTTIGWEWGARIKTKLVVSIGEAGERMGDARDLERFFTVGGRLEAEYRFTPAVSLGAAFFYEHRDRLYEKSSGSLFVRYWW